MTSTKCVGCGASRTGRRYHFHVGKFVGQQQRPEAGDYRILGRYDGFLCNRCAWRWMLLICLTPVLCLAINALVYFGSPPAPMALAVVSAALGLVFGGAFARTVAFSRSPARVLEFLFKSLCWWVGAFGGTAIMMSLFIMSPERGGLLQAIRDNPDDWGHAGYVITAVLICQLISLWTLVDARVPLMELFTWFRRREAIRAELDEPRLLGFNSLRYAALKPPDNDRPA